MPTDSAWRLSPFRTLTLDRPRVLAILNLTPDSFSDGGELTTPEQAAAAAESAMTEGAAGLDLGGESTRPGAARVSAAEQIARVIPALRLVRQRIGDGPIITIDTTLAEVATAALDAGADAVNDVSAGADDEGMLPLIASRRCGVVLMHRLATPENDRYSTDYAGGEEPDYTRGGGIVETVRDFLGRRAMRAIEAGVDRGAIVIDPGLGFGKSVGQNLELIRATPRLVELGCPVLSALSRKSFVAAAAGMDRNRPARERVHASVGMSVTHLLAGARLFRVHDVRTHVEALDAAWALRNPIGAA